MASLSLRIPSKWLRIETAFLTSASCGASALLGESASWGASVPWGAEGLGESAPWDRWCLEECQGLTERRRLGERQHLWERQHLGERQCLGERHHHGELSPQLKKSQKKVLRLTSTSLVFLFSDFFFKTVQFYNTTLHLLILTVLAQD
jgi:hypothetical protein